METNLETLARVNLARARATSPGPLRNLYLLLANRAGKLAATATVKY